MQGRCGSVRKVSVSRRRARFFWNMWLLRRLLLPEAIMHQDGNRVVETAVEARGGLLGRPVLVVLIVSCVLAAGFLLLTYIGVV
jgi:hypothetical protein